VELDRAIGSTLDRTGIDIADATIGTVRRLPNVPYVTPRPPDQPNPLMNQPTAQPDQVQPNQIQPNQAQPNQAEPMQSQPNQIQAQPVQPPQ
jgi:hypothetical protein